MTQSHIPSRIARRAEQGARPAIPSQVAVEKIATEKQNTPNLLVSKKSMIFGSLNTQTLQRKWKVPELVSSAEKTRHDVLCIQEHRFVHPNIDIKEHNFGKWILITCSAWKNSMNAATGGIGILLNSRAYDKITSVEKINPRIMAIHFEGNPMTTVISCYSPTNVTDEQEVELFY